jgi:Serine/threonine protein phosphatase
MQEQKKRHTFPVSVESWGWTQTGTVRKENQDSFLNWPDRFVWAVADGVGSSSQGGVASKMVVRNLMQLGVPASLDDHVQSASGQIHMANEFFYNQKLADGNVSASTVVALLIHSGTAACLWAGDSRCYLLRNSVLYQCTKDHSLRQKKIDSGELTAPEARRMVKGNIITNAVGVNQHLRLEEVRFPVRAGDRFLLTTDGITNLLSTEAIANKLGRDNARDACEGIVDAVEGLRQPDNITLITVFLSHAERE